MGIRRHSEAAFETVIEAHLLKNGYVHVARKSFDRERAIFPETSTATRAQTRHASEWRRAIRAIQSSNCLVVASEA